MGRAILVISGMALLPRSIVQTAPAFTAFCRQLLRPLLEPYHPERHYMRGPGPAWRAKHGSARRD